MANINLHTADATGQKKTFALDTEKPESIYETVEEYAELRAQNDAAPLHAEIASLKAENTSFRGKLVSEIMRVEALTWPVKGEDGKPKYDAEKRLKTWQAVDSEKLSVNYDEAIRTSLKTDPVLTGDPPEDTKDDDPYAT